jgi:hypothetical protein
MYEERGGLCKEDLSRFPPRGMVVGGDQKLRKLV